MPNIAFKRLPLLMALLAGTAWSADRDITTSFSGYGTVAGTFTDRAASEFRTSGAQFTGATDRLTVGLESRLGLQGTVRFGDKFSLTGQALAARRADKDFDIATEWMYGQLNLAPGLDVRLGRVVLPAFFVSDSRYVGYTQPWLRPPEEVYTALPFSSLDGVQALWQKSFGDTVVSAQISHGQTQVDLLVNGNVSTYKGRDAWNVSLGLEHGDWTARLAQTRMTVANSLPIPYDNHDRFIDAGVQYDNGKAIVLAEWVKRTENDIPGFGQPISAITAWYVGAGWRFGDVTPMVRYARIRDDGGLNAFPKQASVGASLRYELVQNVALKAQWDRYDASSQAAFIAPLATTGTKVNVVGFGADFVF